MVSGNQQRVKILLRRDHGLQTVKHRVDWVSYTILVPPIEVVSDPLVDEIQRVMFFSM